MAQAVNPQIAQLKQGVFALIEQTLMGKQVFDALMGNFAVKLLELSQTNLAGKDETFVAVHNQYIQVITASHQNVKAQYDVGREILEAAGKVFDNSALDQFLLTSTQN